MITMTRGIKSQNSSSFYLLLLKLLKKSTLKINERKVDGNADLICNSKVTFNDVKKKAFFKAKCFYFYILILKFCNL